MVHRKAGAKDLSKSDETEKQAPPQDPGGILCVCLSFQGEEALGSLRKECGHCGTHGSGLAGRLLLRQPGQGGRKRVARLDPKAACPEMTHL